MGNKPSRITTLEHMILRDEGRGRSDTFIYTVPKVNKVKAYCKLGKLEDIMEHFEIESIDHLINILEAFKVISNRFEYFEMEEGDVFVNSQESFVQTEPFNTNDLKTIKKVITTKKVSGVNKGCKLATDKQINYLKKYKCNFKHVEKNRNLLDRLINKNFDSWAFHEAWLIISELEEIRFNQYTNKHSKGPLLLDPYWDYPVDF